MRTSYKKFVLFLLTFPVLSFAYQNPGSPSGFVSDFAGILSAGQKAALEAKLSDFEKQSSNEIAIVTIPSLNGDTIENFAVKLFQDYGIGKKNKDNGVLLLVALQERKMRIEVGYGLEGALTDAESYSIISNDLAPAFRAGDYYHGIDTAVDDIISATKGEYQGNASSESSFHFQPSDIFLLLFILMWAAGVVAWFARIIAVTDLWWLGGVFGGIVSLAVSVIFGLIYFGLLSFVVLIPLGLLFGKFVDKKYRVGLSSGRIPWWIKTGGSGRGSGGFGGFGGGSSGGGGASGGW